MPFRVETFNRIDDAAQALSSNPSARIFGGGTLLMRGVNQGTQRFDTLIRVTDPAFNDIRIEGERIVLGAGTTMVQIMAHRDLDFLTAPARAVGGPAVRNAATVGGNINAPAPYGDFATALLALGAQVHLAGQSAGEISIEDFLRDRENQRNRMVQSVSFAKPRDPNAFKFHKVSRVKPKGISVIAMAALLSRDRGATRVAYGNMAPTPVRVPPVEQALEGISLSANAIQPALNVATQGLTPPTDALASEWYRREIAPVHLRRMLLGETG
ncbi:MAG: FAD binding domain-containing protein [Hyphomicrobiales bacterium]